MVEKIIILGERMPGGGSSDNSGKGSIIFCEKITSLTETFESRGLIFRLSYDLIDIFIILQKEINIFSQTMEAEAIVEGRVGKVERHLL